MEIFNGVKILTMPSGKVKIADSLILSKEDIPLLVAALQKEIKTARQLQKQQIRDRITSHEEEVVRLKQNLAELNNN